MPLRVESSPYPIGNEVSLHRAKSIIYIESLQTVSARKRISRIGVKIGKKNLKYLAQFNIRCTSAQYNFTWFRNMKTSF